MRRRRERSSGAGLFFALIMLLIPLVLIVGFSWVFFIGDDEEDGKIGINVITGKVQVDIVDTKDISLVGDVLDFVTADAQEEIYFQPGAIYYTEGFKVKNIGNIPVNVRIYISEDEDKKKLEKAFELWITTDPENLESAEKLTSFTGELEVEQSSDTYYLVIKMKETAGNEFQDKTYTGIGVTVYAVQGNVEIEE